MGGIADAVFGSKDSGGQKGSAPVMTKDQKRLLADIIGQIRPRIGQGVDPYGGDITSGPSDLQGQAFQYLSGLLGGPQLDSAQQSIERLMQNPAQYDATAVKSMNLSGANTPDRIDAMGPTGTRAAEVLRNRTVGPFDPTATQDYWQKAIVDPSMRQWENKVVPGLQEKYIRNDALDSGAARRAVAESAGNLQSDLSGQLAGLMYSAKDASDTRQYSAEEKYIGRLLGADEGGLGREFGAGESYANRDFMSQSDFVNKLFGGQESADDRNLQYSGLQLGADEAAAGRNFSSENNFLNRLPQVPGLTNQAYLDPVPLMLGAGGIQRNIENENLGEEFSKWTTSQSYNNPWLTKLAPWTLGAQTSEPIVQGPSQQSGLLGDVGVPLMSAWLMGGM